ncbi:MAG: trans-aconitate 2-methyltransferase [Planctomycetota bacterium]
MTDTAPRDPAFDLASYQALPSQSPYVSHERYENPKESFRFVAAKLAELTADDGPDRTRHVADVGCANGELLYHLRTRFPHWRYTGYDLTPEFIAAGRAYPPMAGIELHVSDMYAIDARQAFDVVTFINVLTLLPGEPETPLLQLLSLVKPGGLLLVDGMFNPYDIEFRAVLMDNSRPESAGKWRPEYAQHSQRTIARILDGRCRSFTFDPIPMPIELPRKPGAPAANVWTFKDEHGRNIITNGTFMMMEKTLLTVQV